jgi:MscS family membrane protein
MAKRPHVPALLGLLGGVAWLSVCPSLGCGQPLGNACLPPGLVAEAPPSLPTDAKFATPRATLKTLYFSVLAYDFRPALIDDAVACLDGGPDQGRDFAEAARLAVELDAVLRELCLPIGAAPNQPSGDTVTLHNADGFRIALSRQRDGRWCFDRQTVDQVPQMYRLALARHRDLQGLRAGLREDYTDPAATMRRFLIDAMSSDYYAAAQALDLNRLSIDQRSEQGPYLAQQLMFVIQRRGWIYFQEVPNQPDGPPYTWHADHDGRIVVERVHGADGKDAWLFSKNTVKNLSLMYAAALHRVPDPHYGQLGTVVAPLAPSAATGTQPPASVPAYLVSPRALLKGFFRVMDEAETDDSRLGQAVEYFDLQAVPAADRPALAAKLAPKLDAVLRKLAIDLTIIPDSWNAPTQVVGRERGLHVELVRRREGTWCFSRATVERVPQLVEHLAAQQRTDRERGGHLETARDTMITFLSAWNHHDDQRAAQCLDLSALHPRARSRVGPVLAFKLKYLIDRIGRVYPEEVPDEPEGPRYIFHSGDQGRIVIARKTDAPDKGKWLFTAETVEQIEPMFLAVLGRSIDESLHGTVAAERRPTAEETPGVWLRLRMPEQARVSVDGLEIYQWLGLVLLVALVWALARLGLAGVVAVLVWVLKRFSSVLTVPFVAAKLRPMMWVAACGLFYGLLPWLDLPAAWLDTILAWRVLVLSIPLGWLGLQAVDLLTAIYTNSELLRPHRSLSDMIVPVCLRLLKGGILVVVIAHLIYQVGHGEYLLHFLTGLGAAGLAASLAAQDILKSFFGTLLLVGERSFKLGDRLKVDGHEGIVERVGFRSMRLRTADGSLVTIPNSTIASASIDIQGSEAPRHHRVSVALGQSLPVEQIASLRDRVHGWLRAHPAVDAETSEVNIDLHRETGAELQVNLLLRNVAGTEEAQVRREINFAVLRMVQGLEEGPNRRRELKAVG